jgi:hypothetical protein
MILRISTTAQVNMLKAVRDLIDNGSGPGILELYTTPLPATPQTAITTQTKLATLTFSKPCAVDPTTGTMTFSAITKDSSADNPGIVAWGRIKTSSGAAVIDADAGLLSAGNTVIQMTSLNVVAGMEVPATSMTLTMPMS